MCSRKIDNLLVHLTQATISYQQAHLFRRFISLVTLMLYLDLFINFDFFFTKAYNWNYLIGTPELEWLKFTIFTNPIILDKLFLILGIIATLVEILGFGSRYTAIVIYCSLLGIIASNSIIRFGGYDVLIEIWFLLIFFTQPPQNLPSQTLFSSYTWRIMQAALLSIYFASGLTKLLSPLWRSGHAFNLIVTDPNFSLFPYFWQNIYTDIKYFLNYVVLLIEIAVPIIIWIPSITRIVACIMMIFHLCIGLSLNVHLFSAIMFCTWILFLQPKKKL